MSNKFILIIFLLSVNLFAYTLNGQVLKTTLIKERGKVFKQEQGKVQAQKTYKIQTKFTFKALAFKIKGNSFKNASVVINQDTSMITPDHDCCDDNGYIYSNLIFTKKEINSFILNSGKLNQKIDYFLINGKPDKLTQDKIYRQKRQYKSSMTTDSCCSKPYAVDQSVWREGLTAPNYTRIFTKVEHCIVHHAAGSNTDTNYTEVVRSYYIYHTEGHGWSDIGYNYLIAQNGLIYKGRDPGGGEQDNVVGAHFCGKNSHTMGICVLGNYMEIPPPEAAMNSLIHLLTWKLNKDTLDPIGVVFHVDRDLDVIAGHRQGCSTDCPGDFLYNKLPKIRTQVADSIVACRPLSISIFLPNNKNSFIYPNPANGNIIYFDSKELIKAKSLKIYNINGSLLMYMDIKENQNSIPINISNLKNGIYFIKLENGKKTINKKLIINR